MNKCKKETYDFYRKQATKSMFIYFLENATISREFAEDEGNK